MTATAATSETTTACRTAATCFEAGIAGASPGSADAVTIAVRGGRRTRVAGRRSRPTR